jgi:hypothetical protein
MRCALVIPSGPEDIFSSKTASSQINYWQPLGTLYVAAVLQQAGMKSDFQRRLPFARRGPSPVNQFCSAFIGIYSTTFGWKKAKKTAADFQEHIRAEGLYLCREALILSLCRRNVLLTQGTHGRCCL